ncbi:Hypothetical protein CINCED_3A005746 [Cinara cedri]|uniref:Uncharacterized protein n=1 Tax=Cinara cedri TaxID=506608 RepID=A0A5E4MCY4_9HEMI|nr:Hypothetical protein CINCED_3A005746 [Cinara cedri]
MGLLICSVYLILITKIINITGNNINQEDESSRSAKSILEKVFYPRTKTQSTVNHHSFGLHNSFGVSGNVGIGFHYGSGYRIKNGDGNDEQQIVHKKMYDKYLGTSFGFGSLGNVNNGHISDIKESNSADQQYIHNDENNLVEQDSDNDTIPVTEKPKSGVFRKISDYWAGEHSEPKSDYTNNGIFKWSMQKIKNKNNIGTPR